MSTPPKTGWPAPELAQDDCRGLFRWFASKPDARVRVREALSCCEFHGVDCNQGRACPERTRRQQEAEARHQTERFIAADPIGVESALPIQFAGTEPEGEFLEKTVVWIVAAVAVVAILAAVIPAF